MVWEVFLEMSSTDSQTKDHQLHHQTRMTILDLIPMTECHREDHRQIPSMPEVRTLGIQEIHRPDRPARLDLGIQEIHRPDRPDRPARLDHGIQVIHRPVNVLCQNAGFRRQHGHPEHRVD